jgi:hypothetical protein
MKKYILLAIIGIIALGALVILNPDTNNSFTGASVSDNRLYENVEKIQIKENILEVQVLGKHGFDLKGYIANKNQEILFTNQDPKQKDMVLTFQRDKSREIFNSPIIKAGQSYSYTFDKEGDYEFWTIGYGVKSKLNILN